MIATETTSENIQIASLNEKLKQYNLEVVSHQQNKVFVALESPTFDPTSLKEIARSLAENTHAQVRYSKNIDALSQSESQSKTDSPDRDPTAFNLDSTKGLKQAITFLRQSSSGADFENLKTKIETVIAKRIDNPPTAPSAPVDFLRQAVEAVQAGIVHYGDQEITLSPAEIKQIKDSVDVELQNLKQMRKNSQNQTSPNERNAAENLAFAQLELENEGSPIQILLFPNQHMAQIASKKH